MRFATPAEAPGGCVGQMLCALRICKLWGRLAGERLGALGIYPWGYLGGPWATLVIPNQEKVALVATRSILSWG